MRAAKPARGLMRQKRIVSPKATHQWSRAQRRQSTMCRAPHVGGYITMIRADEEP